MGNLITNLDFLLRVGLIPPGMIIHGGDKPWCIQSERYPICGGLAKKRRLAQALLCIILKVFRNHLYYLWHVRVLSIKPCLHTQLPEHNRSYWKVSRRWGHLITWNGPMMGHLNSFSASGGGIWTKIFQKFKCPGGCPGGLFKLRFDWYISTAILAFFDNWIEENASTLELKDLARVLLHFRYVFYFFPKKGKWAMNNMKLVKWTGFSVRKVNIIKQLQHVLRSDKHLKSRDLK